MDYDGAIQAHTNWKLRLYSYSRGKLAEKLDLRTLQRDDVCSLGQWLHGEGRGAFARDQYKRLVETHAAFHKCAAAIGVMVEYGEAASAEALLNSADSEFNRLSIRIVGLLMALREGQAVV